MANNPGQNPSAGEKGLPIGVIFFFSLGMVLCLWLIRKALEINHLPSLIAALALFFICGFMVFLSFSFLFDPLKISPPRLKLGFAIFISVLWTLSAWFLLNRITPRRPVFDQNFWEKAIQVCSGKGIPNSAAYNEEVGVHAVVPQTRESVFYGKLPLAWFPDSLVSTELVLCYDARQKIVETCQFLPAGSMKRVQYELDVHLVSVSSGKSIAEQVFFGGMPEVCPPNLLAKSGGEENIANGTPVNLDEVIEWLEGFVIRK